MKIRAPLFLLVFLPLLPFFAEVIAVFGLLRADSRSAEAVLNIIGPPPEKTKVREVAVKYVDSQIANYEAAQKDMKFYWWVLLIAFAVQGLVEAFRFYSKNPAKLWDLVPLRDLLSPTHSTGNRVFPLPGELDALDRRVGANSERIDKLEDRVQESSVAKVQSPSGGKDIEQTTPSENQIGDKPG